MLNKQRKPYPRVVLLCQDSKGEFSYEEKKYKIAHKVTTYSGLLQHLTHSWRKYSKDGSCLYLCSTYKSGIREMNADKSVIIVDLGLYEENTGLRVIKRLSRNELESDSLESIAKTQKIINEIERKHSEEISSLKETVTILTERLERLESKLEKVNNKKQDIRTDLMNQLSLF